MRIGINTLFSTEALTRSIDEKISSTDLHIDVVQGEMSSIREGLIDCLATPMHLLPVELDEGLRITALVPCGTRTYSLLIHRSLANTEQRLGFYSGMEISSPVDFQVSGLHNIWPSMSFIEAEAEATLTYIKEKKQGNFIAETCFLPEGSDEDYKILELNEREFGHMAGQGMMALVMKQESTFMKVIRRWNSAELISVSNVERNCIKEVGVKANVHCERDQEGNYLLWLFTETEAVHIAQSTRNELEARIIQKLQNTT